MADSFGSGDNAENDRGPRPPTERVDTSGVGSGSCRASIANGHDYPVAEALAGNLLGHLVPLF